METKPTSTTKKAAPKRAAKKPATTAPKAAIAVNPAPTPGAKRPPAKRLTARRTSKTASVNLSLDDIALRAYFIAEKRQQQGWPGTPDGDWLEAERQLRSEHGLN